MLSLLVAVRRLGMTLASAAEEQLSRAGQKYRLELRRMAMVMTLALASVLLAIAALAFLALAVMVAFWSTHPVAASASIALVFGVLSVAAVLLVRQGTGK